MELDRRNKEWESVGLKRTLVSQPSVVGKFEPLNGAQGKDWFFPTGHVGLQMVGQVLSLLLAINVISSQSELWYFQWITFFTTAHWCVAVGVKTFDMHGEKWRGIVQGDCSLLVEDVVCVFGGSWRWPVGRGIEMVVQEIRCYLPQLQLQIMSPPRGVPLGDWAWFRWFVDLG